MPLWLNIPMFTSPAGTLQLNFTWPAGTPSGSKLFYQVSFKDPAAIYGVSLSNAIKATVP